jgi:hypothetical protein
VARDDEYSLKDVRAALPDLRHELAQCPRCGSMSDPCQVGYLDPVDQ